MSARHDHHHRWTMAYLRPLVGARILSVKLGDGTWPVLVVRLADGEVIDVEVSADEEGNGPGFLHGLPFPSEQEVGT